MNHTPCWRFTYFVPFLVFIFLHISAQRGQLVFDTFWILVVRIFISGA